MALIYTAALISQILNPVQHEAHAGLSPVETPRPGLQDEQLLAPMNNPLDPLAPLIGGQWRPVDLTMLNEYTRYRWGAGERSMLFTTWQAGDDGLDPAAGVGLFYWDPAREVIAGTTVLDQGRLKDMIVEVQEGRLDFKHDYYSGGTTSKWIETFGWDGADSYQYQAFIIGEAPLEWLNLRCAREEEGASALPVMPMDEGESAKLGALEPMMGNWKVTKTDHRDDSVHESRNIVYWGLDRSVILWRDIASVDGVDTPVSDALIYWSPKTSSIELLQVTDSGEVVRASLAENDEGLFGACKTVTGVEDDQAEGPGSFMTVTFETDRAGFTISTWRATEDPERRVAETSIVFEPFE